MKTKIVRNMAGLSSISASSRACPRLSDHKTLLSNRSCKKATQILSRRINEPLLVSRWIVLSTCNHLPSNLATPQQLPVVEEGVTVQNTKSLSPSLRPKIRPPLLQTAMPWASPRVLLKSERKHHLLLEGEIVERPYACLEPRNSSLHRFFCNNIMTVIHEKTFVRSYLLKKWAMTTLLRKVRAKTGGVKANVISPGGLPCKKGHRKDDSRSSNWKSHLSWGTDVTFWRGRKKLLLKLSFLQMHVIWRVQNSTI